MEKNYHITGKSDSFVFLCLKRNCASAILSLALLSPIIAFGQSSKQQPIWEKKNLSHELENKRTRNAKHFLNADNHVSAFISPSSLHYLDANKNWKDINTDIVTDLNDPDHPYKSEENAVKTYFPANPFTNSILMSTQEGNFREGIKSIKFLSASKSVISTLPLLPSVKTRIEGNRIIYSGFHKDLSLSYDLNNDSRKFDLIIHSGKFLSSIPAGAKYISIEEEFVPEDIQAQLRTHGDQMIVVSKGTEVFSFEKPIGFDASTSKESFTNGSIEFAQNKNTFILTSCFELSWIGSSERHYPVHLDPTTNYYPQNTSMWTGNQSSSGSKSSGMLRITTSSTASWAKFDLTNLPVGCTVTQATYYGYHYSTTSSAKICEIRGLSTLDPVSASASTLFTQSHNGTIYNGNYTYGGSTYSWNPGALNSAGLADVAAAAGSWIGLGFCYLSGSTTFMYHYGINGTSSQMCYLEVVYYTVPCSSIPGANSVVTPTGAICPGSFATIGLANTYSVGGIAFQWQMSTASAVGPFTAIAGATNAAYTTPTLNVQTWYTAIITCTNVAGNITAIAGVVSIQPTTIDSLPYSEGFEGLDTENKLPNCSWSASNLGVTALTYTTSSTAGRVPHSGNSFASFYYNPGGAKYFYTNGLYLSSGVTYSASLWYQTEYYGYQNWTDLSILVGPNQSPTGLNTIVSTNGPAVSNVYKLLSDTFSVPSTGVYYIAVRGTGGTSSSAQYLSWDDLSVTIPCALNTPSISLSASSTTICEGTSVNILATGTDSYHWNTGSTSNSINESPASSVVYQVVGTNIISGCTSTASQTITVNPAPVIYLYATSNSVCAGTSINITALGQNSYTWSSGGFGAATNVSPTSTTTYSVIGANSYGCTGTASQQIFVYPLPGISVNSSMPEEMCAGETVTLTGTGGVSYQWTSSSSSLLYAGSPISDMPVTSTIYTVTGTDIHGCTNKATFLQNVSECTDINSLSGDVLSTRVFPNPTTGQLIIESRTHTEKQIELLDVTGRIIISNTSNMDRMQMNLSELASGMYYLKIKSEEKPEVIRVLKQ
jgi:hypothetical protein